jgi:hypothetical protein
MKNLSPGGITPGRDFSEYEGEMLTAKSLLLMLANSQYLHKL